MNRYAKHPKSSHHALVGSRKRATKVVQIGYNVPARANYRYFTLILSRDKKRMVDACCARLVGRCTTVRYSCLPSFKIVLAYGNGVASLARLNAQEMPESFQSIPALPTSPPINKYVMNNRFSRTLNASSLPPS